MCIGCVRMHTGKWGFKSPSDTQIRALIQLSYGSQAPPVHHRKSPAGTLPPSGHTRNCYSPAAQSTSPAGARERAAPVSELRLARLLVRRCRPLVTWLSQTLPDGPGRKRPLWTLAGPGLRKGG
jgi:hypothetical protein